MRAVETSTSMENDQGKKDTFNVKKTNKPPKEINSRKQKIKY